MGWLAVKTYREAPVLDTDSGRTAAAGTGCAQGTVCGPIRRRNGQAGPGGADSQSVHRCLTPERTGACPNRTEGISEPYSR